MYFGIVITLFGLFDFHYLLYQKHKHNNCFKSHIIWNPFLSILYGISLFYNSFTIFIFHAYGSKITNQHTTASALIQLTVVLNFLTTLFVPFDVEYTAKYKIIIIFSCLVFSCIILSFSLTDNISELISTIILSILICLIAISISIAFIIRKKSYNLTPLTNQTKGYLLVSIICFILGGLLQEEFITLKCNDTSYFQPHGFSHVLTSIALFSFYMFFRSDGKEPLTLSSSSIRRSTL